MDHKYLSYTGLKRFFYTKILKLINLKVDKTNGDISNTKIRSIEVSTAKFPVPSSGEGTKVFLGKIITFLKNIKPLEADVALYVSPTGSDTANVGSAASSPFKTIKYALSTIPKDLGGFTATIYIADGTYDEIVDIRGFSGGTIDVRSLSSATALNTVCRVKQMTIFYCSAKINIFGIYFTQTDGAAIDVMNNSMMVYIMYCQAVESAPAYYGFNFQYSKARIEGCRTQNHSTGFRSYFSEVYSMDWATDSLSVQYGMTVDAGGRVAKTGVQPSGGISSEYIKNGGTIIESNGTQILNITKTGLACTWGNISGGYIRHGNSNGVAMVTVQLNITVTTNLTANTDYTITGFPVLTDICAVATSVGAKTSNCYMHKSGALYFAPNVSISAGSNQILFNCTYLTT